MRRISAMILALAIAVSFFTLTVSAESVGNHKNRVLNEDMINAVEELKQSAMLSDFSPDEEVTVTAVLSDSPVMDYAEGLSGASFIGFRNSVIGTSVADNLRIAHESAKNRLKSLFDVSFSDSYDFYLIANSFTFRTAYRNLDNIQKLDFIKYAYVSGEYEAPPHEVISDIDMYTSSAMIGADIVNDTGYTGKGILVGVLDSGLDLTHEALSNRPPVSTITRNTLLGHISKGEFNADGEGLYKNYKVVFGYDYAGKDVDIANPENDHGMHVTGIIAGKTIDNTGNVTFSGIAPDAEVAFFKVFPDGDGGASDANIKAALEDAVVLGVDVLNMSLGSSSGFTVDAYEDMADIYERVQAAGICLCTSCGNSYHMGVLQNDYNQPYIDTPVYNVTGSPGTYAASLSTASIDNAVMFDDNYFTVAGQKYLYYDNAGEAEPHFKNLVNADGGKEFDIVFIPNLGDPADYEGLDVSGKIVFVSRGSSTFVAKKDAALKAGAAAIVIYNNTEGVLSYTLDVYNIPAVGITYGQYMAIKASGADKLTIATESAFVTNPEGCIMSAFSSWGPTDTLLLKPEITAPGGMIYSTLYNNTYGVMSGTSMAAPHAAGACAVALQYLNSLSSTETLSKYEKAQLVNNLIMSTAHPVENSEGNCYSPRKQGAGLIDLNALISADSYLSVESGRPKIEAGFNEYGVFDISFEITNMSSEAKDYTITSEFTIDNIVNYPYINDSDEVIDDYYVDAMNGSNISLEAGSSADYEITLPDTVTVPAESTQSVSGRVILNENTLDFIYSYFINGTYLDGFIFLSTEDEELSIPFLGFCGNWDKLRLFDGSYADGYYCYSLGRMRLLFEYEGNMMALPLTHNYSENGGVYTYFNIDTVRNVTGFDADAMLSSDMGLLRNAENITYRIYRADNQGNLSEEPVMQYVYTHENGRYCKSYFFLNGGFTDSLVDDYDYLNEEWSIAQLEAGTYAYCISAVPEGCDPAVYTQETTPIFFCIDTVAPEITEGSICFENNSYLYTVTVRDDMCLLNENDTEDGFMFVPCDSAKQSASPTLPADMPLMPGIVSDIRNNDNTHTYTFDVTSIVNYAVEGSINGLDISADTFIFTAYDAAYNNTAAIATTVNGIPDNSRTELAKLLSYAASLDEKDYAQVSWMQLNFVVTYANTVYSKKHISDAELENAAMMMKAVIGFLQPAGGFYI